MHESGTDKARVLTLDIKPRRTEAIKPAELIHVSGHHELTLNARRASDCPTRAASRCLSNAAQSPATNAKSRILRSFSGGTPLKTTRSRLTRQLFMKT